MKFMTFLVQLIFAISVLWTKSKLASLVTVLCGIPMFYVGYRNGKISYDADVEAKKSVRRADYLQEVLQSRESVEERTLFGYSEYLNPVWNRKFSEADKMILNAQIKYWKNSVSMNIFTTVMTSLILFSLLLSMKTGAMTVGMFIGIVTMMQDVIVTARWKFTYALYGLSQLREWLNDLTAFCALKEQEAADAEPKDMRQMVIRSLEFRDVSFAYPGTEKKVLEHLNLNLEEGRHYAIVGINGAGKTTITKLLLGLYDNYEGEIFINGKNLREYGQKELKGIFSVVYAPCQIEYAEKNGGSGQYCTTVLRDWSVYDIFHDVPSIRFRLLILAQRQM